MITVGVKDHGVKLTSFKEDEQMQHSTQSKSNCNFKAGQFMLASLTSKLAISQGHKPHPLRNTPQVGTKCSFKYCHLNNTEYVPKRTFWKRENNNSYRWLKKRREIHGGFLRQQLWSKQTLRVQEQFTPKCHMMDKQQVRADTFIPLLAISRGTWLPVGGIKRVD